ncbi:MAG: hypothetical protein ACI3V5_06890 [Faecousia sp.]
MREFQVRLQSVQEVQEFVALATARAFSVTIRDANNKVNGKSFMEMFCLDLRCPLRVVMDCGDEAFEAFRNDVEKFLVK